MRTMTAEPTMPRAAEPMDPRKQAPQVLDSPPPVQSTEHERAIEQILAPAPEQAPTSTSQLSNQQPEPVSDLSSTMQPLPREQDAGLSAQTPEPVASSTARADYAWLSGDDHAPHAGTEEVPDGGETRAGRERSGLEGGSPKQWEHRGH